MKFNTQMQSSATLIALEKSNVRPFHSFETLKQYQQKQPSWIYRLFLLLGIIMANADDPKGWNLNPAVITLALTIAGLLLIGGYYVGQRDAESRHLLERIAIAEKDAAEARKLQTYSSGVADTHTKETKTK